MRDKIQQIREKALAEIDKADGLEKLNDVRAAILGKKGELTAVLKGMKDVAPEDRPKVGQWSMRHVRQLRSFLMRRLRNLRQRHLSASMRARK